MDLNHRPLGYEPNELPDCSTPHPYPIAAQVERQIIPAASSPVRARRAHPCRLAEFLDLCILKGLLQPTRMQIRCNIFQHHGRFPLGQQIDLKIYDAVSNTLGHCPVAKLLLQSCNSIDIGLCWDGALVRTDHSTPPGAG